jgi:hypothetical protein
MALPEDLSDELQRSLAALLGDDRALRAAVHPLIKGAFHRGAAFAVQQMMEMGARYLAALDAANRPVEEPAAAAAHGAAAHDQVPRRARAPIRRRRRSEVRPRAAVGAVGQALDLVLAEHPGLRIVEAQSLVKELDPTISPTSVTNELRRKKGIRYRQEGVHWFRIGDTEKGTAEVGSFANGADLLGEGSKVAAATLDFSRGRAA